MIAARIYREQRNGGALRMWSGYCSKKMQMSSQTMSSWVSAGTTVEGWGVLSIPPLFQALSDPCLWGGSLQTSSVAQRWVSKPLKIKPPTPFLINFKSFCCTHQDHKADVNFHPFVLNELFCSHAPEKKTCLIYIKHEKMNEILRAMRCPDKEYSFSDEYYANNIKN